MEKEPMSQKIAETRGKTRVEIVLEPGGKAGQVIVGLLPKLIINAKNWISQKLAENDKKSKKRSEK